MSDTERTISYSATASLYHVSRLDQRITRVPAHGTRSRLHKAGNAVPEHVLDEGSHCHGIYTDGFTVVSIDNRGVRLSAGRSHGRQPMMA